MKKVLLISLAAMLAAPTFAQDQIGDDCTKYIVNAGFDEDLTWNVDGSTKTIVDKSKKLSDRSQAWMAEDGTGYCWGGISSRKRKDDAEFGWNGFLGQVKGWTVANGNKNSLTDWCYFGTAPYALGEKAVPIADDGDTYLEAPAKPDEVQGDDNKGFLYLRAGWGNWATYTQTVHVPVGKYTLSYWVFNANYEKSKDNKKVKNLSQVVCRRDTVVDADGFNASTWTKHEMDITATDSLTITLGYKSDGGSASNPFVLIDDIRLTKIDDVTRQEIIASDIEELVAKFDEIEGDLMDYQGLVVEIEDAKIAADEAASSDDVDVLTAGYEAANAAYKRFAAVKDNIAKLQLLEKKATALRETGYPGLDELDAAINAVEDAITNGTTLDIEAQVTTFDAAIKTYLASKDATVDDPADYTYYAQNTWFIKDGLEPTVNADGSCTYPNATKADGTANYENGKGNDDLTSNAWYKGSFTEGDQRLNFAQGRSCWNAWAQNFDDLSVNQDIKGLPNGYYMVAGDLITQDNCVSDQHVFAKSPVDEAVSEPLTVGTWNASTNDGAWTTLTTGKVLVYDGRLTIGATGTNMPSSTTVPSQNGWFCATNFKLYYVGKATAEEIAAAIAKREQLAANLADGMHYAGDKASVKDSIEAYKAQNNIDVLNNGIKLGNKSEAKYTEVMAEGKTLPTVQANLADESSYAPVHNIVAFAWEKTNNYLTSDKATYTAVDGKITELKRYTETYYNAAHEVDSVSATLKSAVAKKALTATLNEQVSVLTLGDSIQNDATVTALIAQLKNAITQAQAQDLYEKNPNTTDYTSMILNPDAAAETGWNINKGTGNTNTGVGQYYDKRQETTHRYFDSWNGTAGALNYYADQKVIGLPNGTYKVTVCARTMGTGSYVFSANGEQAADTTWVEIPTQTFNWTHNDMGIGGETKADGTDSIVGAADQFGQIWEDAFYEYQKNPSRDDLAGIVNANNGKGRGWQRLTWTAEVINHELTLGMTTDSLRTGKAGFTGTWFSVVDWTLELTQAGDNNGWFGPITGVSVLEVNKNQKLNAIYSINGQRVASMAKPGLYIVIKNGKAQKVMVK